MADPPLVDVHGDPDWICLIADRAIDGLADPPDGMGRELVAAAPVELLGRPDETERAFLDEVEQRDAMVLVALGNGYDEAKVRVDHLHLRLDVAPFDPLGELYFFGSGEQSVAAYLAQIERKRVSDTWGGFACSG